MFKYTGPKCRLCRREQQDLSLKSKPVTSKCNFNKRPGQHGLKSYRQSQKGLALREKQKAKRIYNVTESTFKNYYKIAAKDTLSKEDKLIDLLESRLDNVVYRAGFALTRAHARQLVSHKLVLLNGKKCNIPSCQVKVGDTIALLDKIKNNQYVIQALKSNRTTSNWIQVDVSKLTVTKDTQVQIPKEHREFIDKYIIEFYASK